MDPRPRWLTGRNCSPYRASLEVDLLILVRLLAFLTRLLLLLLDLLILLLLLLLRYKMFPSTDIASAAYCTSCTSPRLRG